MTNDRERAIKDDEIDLLELIRVLWQQKLLIILATFVIGGGALTYAQLATPIYEAKVFVQPPSQNDVVHLNYGRGGNTDLPVLEVKDVYEIYVRNLQSESLRRRFFQDVYLPALSDMARQGGQDDLYARLGKVLTVSGVKETPSRYAIVVNLPDPKRAIDWAVKYAEMAGERAKLEVLKDVNADADVKANNLEQQIKAAQQSARKQREDRITRLKEALTIARSIGLEKPPMITGKLSTEVSAGMGGALTYMRGSKALLAEIDNLERRASDDPFIERLREAQSSLVFYRSLKANASSVATYRQDGVIESPDSPIKPRKSMIVFLGLIVGAAFGVLLVLLRYFWLGVSGKRMPGN